MCGEETRRIKSPPEKWQTADLMVWRFLFCHEFLMQPKGQIMNSPDNSEEQQRQIKIDADIDEVVKTIQGLGLKPDEKTTTTDSCGENPSPRRNRWMRLAVITVTHEKLECVGTRRITQSATRCTAAVQPIP